MKKHVKFSLQILLILAITIPFFPQQNAASAYESAATDTPAKFHIVETSDDSLELLLLAPAYQTAKTEIGGAVYDTIEVPGAILTASPGQIQLPIVSTLIGVPPEAEVTLEILEDKPQRLQGNFNLAQAPYPAQIDDINATERWDYAQEISLPDTEINSISSNPVARIAEEAWIRDMRVVRIEYTPFQYNASNGILTWHPNVKAKLQFKTPFGISANQLTENRDPGNSPFDTILQTSLLNYEQAKNWRSLAVSTNIQTTPPDTGPRYRIAIQEDGIYELTYNDLLAVNPAVAGFDLARMQMTSQGEDIAIYVKNGGDGSFEPGDSIIFYGQRFYGDQLADLYQDENMWWRTFTQQQTDGTYKLWKPEFNALMLEKYTHENVYWLFEGASNGLRMGTVNGNPSGNSNAPVPHYRATVRAGRIQLVEEHTIRRGRNLVLGDNFEWQAPLYRQCERACNHGRSGHPALGICFSIEFCSRWI